MNWKYLPIAGLLIATGCNYGDPTTDTSDSDADNTPAIERLTVKRVLSYTPAPGQYVNLLPPYSEGDDANAMAAKAVDYLNRCYAVTLGAFGGSITIELDVPITRQSGHSEFLVAGNAISNGSEPAIVEVSADAVTWYQLQGEFPTSELPYTHITYRNPGVPDQDIPFTAVTHGETSTGVVAYLPQYRTQSYWPSWIDAATLEFSAPRLPDNANLNPSTGQYEFTPYIGYADSYPNSSPLSYLSLDNAIDPLSGTKADMASATYIRVTTSILQHNGPLGECSSEISGIYVIR